MKLLDLTLDTPEENLAIDEALLEQAEAGLIHDDVLRLWESKQTAVIIGRSSKIDEEVDRAACDRQSVPVLRRCSGGTSVVIGPGCLMYAVVLSFERYPGLRMVDEAHRFVLGKVAESVRALVPNVSLQGTSDLTAGNRKFSGNSLRCKRDHLLYHGTLLCEFPLDSIERLLKSPPRQPDYREQRNHGEFVTNLHVDPVELRSMLVQAWNAVSVLDAWGEDFAARLVEERYSRPDWHARL